MFDEEKKLEETSEEEEELEEPVEDPIEEAHHEKEELGPVEEIIPDSPPEKKPWWKFW